MEGLLPPPDEPTFRSATMRLLSTKPAFTKGARARMVAVAMQPGQATSCAFFISSRWRSGAKLPWLLLLADEAAVCVGVLRQRILCRLLFRFLTLAFLLDSLC